MEKLAEHGNMAYSEYLSASWDKLNPILWIQAYRSSRGFRTSIGKGLILQPTASQPQPE
jgi:hypothetical protein